MSSNLDRLLSTQIAHLWSEQRTDIAGVRAETANLETRFIRWMVGTVVATATLTLGILRLPWLAPPLSRRSADSGTDSTHALRDWRRGGLTGLVHEVTAGAPLVHRPAFRRAARFEIALGGDHRGPECCNVGQFGSRMTWTSGPAGRPRCWGRGFPRRDRERDFELPCRPGERRVLVAEGFRRKGRGR